MLNLHCSWTNRVLALGLVGFALLVVAWQPVRADTCSLDQLTKTADDVGASLRRYNNDAMPKVVAKMQQLRLKKGWSQANYRELTADYLHDARIAGFDKKANRLFLKIGSLSPNENDIKVECSRIAELRASGLELLAVMKAKSAHTISKIDKELQPKPKVVLKKSIKPAPKKPSPALKTEQKVKTAKNKQISTLKPSGEAADATPSPSNDRSLTPDDEVAIFAPDASSGPWETDTFKESNLQGAANSYTMEEIRKASRGFFGTISTSLASVIEYSFKNLGRPTAYVLGNEGGGAFLAGLRYGKGKLYMRNGGISQVYWHGPSVGYDFGASGSRTMFLIYKLDRPERLFRSYTGIDGSAFLVGGVGITFLKGGSVVMAPIRSGIGLRIGASIGYVRFTPTATWNPF